jgi:hypothetical protein
MKQKLQNQTQQVISQAGGVAMDKIQAQQNHQTQQQGGQAMQTQVIFVTFTHKLSPEKAKQIIKELRVRFPSQILVFSPKPQKGKKIILNVNEEVVIITIPYSRKQEHSTEQTQMQTTQGFLLKDLIKNKI